MYEDTRRDFCFIGVHSDVVWEVRFGARLDFYYVDWTSGWKASIAGVALGIAYLLKVHAFVPSVPRDMFDVTPAT